MEDAERKYRQKKLIEAQKKKRDMELLHEARRQQQEEKLEKQRLVAEQKQEEYISALRHASSMAERERAEEVYAKKKNAELIQNLQQQIEENKAAKAARDRQKFQEGGRIKQELVSAKLAVICVLMRSLFYIVSNCFQIISTSRLRPKREPSLRVSETKW
jgi:hypothetical protein